MFHNVCANKRGDEPRRDDLPSLSVRLSPSLSRRGVGFGISVFWFLGFRFSVFGSWNGFEMLT